LLAADATESRSNLEPYNTTITNGFLYTEATGTNGASVGIRLHNEEPINIYVDIFFDTKVAERSFWIAPPQFQRVEYFLYDSGGKPVLFSTEYSPPNREYKTLTEVPKGTHNEPKGIMMESQFPMFYDQAALTNIFQITNNGDYKLVVKVRIMKVNNDSTLSLMEFPSVSLPIHIANP
jgi:hypothetical protein